MTAWSLSSSNMIPRWEGCSGEREHGCKGGRSVGGHAANRVGAAPAKDCLDLLLAMSTFSWSFERQLLAPFNESAFRSSLKLWGKRQ